MSDDLVKRARDDAFLSRATKAAHEVPRAELVEALADEIDRLQAEAEGAAAIIMTERAEVMRLRAENARLREALRDATAHLAAAASAYQHYAKRHHSLGVPPVDALFSTRSKDFEDAAKRARAALQNKGGE